MTGRPWEKYQQQAQPAPTGKPWEKYGAQPTAAPVTPTAPPVVNDGKTLSNAPLAVQGLGGFVQGLAGLPGLPADMQAAAFNFIARNTGGQEVSAGQLKDPLDAVPVLGGLKRAYNAVAPSIGLDPIRGGSDGWSDAVMGAAGMPKVAAPRNDAERVVQKGGFFLGGGAPFGPAGLLPTATAFAGSEAGRVADQVAPELTKGYGEAAGGFAGGIAGSLRRPPSRTPAPTRADIQAAADKAFKDAERAGAIYSPQATGRLQGEVDTFLASKAFDEQMQPQVNRVRAKLDERVSNGVNVTLKDLHNLRIQAGNAAASGNATERMMGQQLQQLIDDFLEGPMQAGDVVAGDSAIAAAKLREGIRQWATLKKLDRVDDALVNAELQAESAHWGGNIDNATRQKLRPMLTRGNKQSRGWTPDEKAMLRKVIRGGGITQNVLRSAGKMSPGGGLMNMLWLGAAGGGAAATGGASLLPTLLAAGGTAAAKRVADAMTRSNVEDLLHTIQRGGTAYQPRTPGRMLTRASAALPGVVQSQRDQ